MFLIKVGFIATCDVEELLRDIYLKNIREITTYGLLSIMTHRFNLEIIVIYNCWNFF